MPPGIATNTSYHNKRSLCTDHPGKRPHRFPDAKAARTGSRTEFSPGLYLHREPWGDRQANWKCCMSENGRSTDFRLYERTIGSIGMNFIEKIITILFPLKLTRKDCPHWNIDGYGHCNLLPEPENCIGYERCRKLKRYTR